MLTKSFIVGTLFLLMFAFNSYKTPNANFRLMLTPYSNINLTTNPKYFGYFFLYFILLWVVYSFVTYAFSDDAIRGMLTEYFHNQGFTNPYIPKLGDPLGVALFIITVVPNIKKIKELNDSVLEKFWEYGMIPSQVLEIMDRIDKADFIVSKKNLKKIDEELTAEIVNAGFDFSKKRCRSHEWQKIQLLINCIDEIKNEKGYFSFFQKYQAVYDDIVKENRTVTSLFKTIIEQRRGSFSSAENPKVNKVFDNQLKNGHRVLLKKIYQLIAMAVLTVKNNEGDVVAELKKFGFDHIGRLNKRHESVNWTNVLFVLFVMFIVCAALQGFHFGFVSTTETGSFNTIPFFKITIQTTFMYTLAALIPTVLLKPRFLLLLPPSYVSFERRFVSNLISVIITIVAVYVFIVVFQVLWNSIISGKSIDYQNLCVSEYWIFLVQVATLALFVRCVSNRFVHSERSEAKFTRFIDAVIVTIPLAFFGIIVATCLLEIDWHKFTSESDKFKKQSQNLGGIFEVFAWYIFKTGCVGFTAGYVAPFLYRKNRIANNRKRMKSIFSGDREDFHLEIEKFDKNEFDELFCVCMAFVSAADGVLHDYEDEQFKKNVEDLVDEEVIDVDTVNFHGNYQKYTEEFISSPDNLLGQEKVSILQKFSTSITLKNFIMLKSIEIASVDGELTDSEIKAIGKIARKLGFRDFNIDSFLRPLTSS